MQEPQTAFLNALLEVDRISVQEILAHAFKDENALQIVEELVVPSMEKIGQGWENGLYSLSQVYMSGRLCEEAVDVILPPRDQNRTSQPKTAIVVLEDYHLLGSRIVYSALRASGFELKNLGRMSVAETADRVHQEKIKILLISVLMLPSALRVKQLRTKLNELGCEVKMIVGGAPFRFDDQLWQEVGADATGNTAGEAVELVHRMIEELS